MTNINDYICDVSNCGKKCKPTYKYCPEHIHQHDSIMNIRCHVKLCENERFEGMLFCEKHCKEFFEKQESELLHKVDRVSKDLFDAQKHNNSLRLEVNHLRNVIQGVVQEMGQIPLNKPAPSPLLTDVINSKGLILCSVETMKKILNGGEL